VPNAPAASCALGVVSMHTSIHSGGTGNIRHSRARMVLTVSFALSPVTSSFLPPSPRGLNGFARPVGLPKPPQDLAPATGARTTRLLRTHQCRSSCTPATAHESLRPAITALRTRHRRVHRIPLPTSVTIAIRPSCGGGTARRNHIFLKNRSDLFLPGHLDSRINVELLGKIRFYAHAISGASGPLSRAAPSALELICPTSGKSVDLSAVARTADQPH
jgi:hypothetical protein